MKHRCKDYPPWATERLLDLVERLNLESPDLRPLMGAAMGPDKLRRMDEDCAARDSWDNEGGALAYHHR